jgi:hypothetical protein
MAATFARLCHRYGRRALLMTLLSCSGAFWLQWNASASALNSKSGASKIALAAVAASGSASSFSYEGGGITGGKKLSLSFTIGVNSGSGTFTDGKETVNLVRVGDRIYAQEVTNPPQPWSTFKKGTSGYSSFAKLLIPKSVLSSFFTGVIAARLSRSIDAVVRGQSTFVVTGKVQGETDTLYVADQGSPYLLRSVGAGGGSIGNGTIDFYNYDQPINVKAPVS